MKMFGKRKDPPPRKLEEIVQEYNQTAFQAGQAQYQAKVYQAEVDKLNKRMLELNQEADRRKQADNAARAKAAEAAAKNPPPTELKEGGK